MEAQILKTANANDALEKKTTWGTGVAALLVNSNKQSSSIKTTKTKHYNAVIAQQLSRIIEGKLQDPRYVIDDVLCLPPNFLPMMEKLHSGTVVLKDLSKDVGQYGWLESMILKIANMPFMKEEGEDQDVIIKGLGHALPFLGLHANQVILPYLVLRHSIQNNHNGLLQDIGSRLWYYTLNVANVALETAELTGMGNPRLAFTAGIFHGLAHVAIYKLFITMFEEVKQANFELARKQFNKDLFNAMQLIEPQRSLLSELYHSHARFLSMNLMNAFTSSDFNLSSLHQYDNGKGQSVLDDNTPLSNAIAYSNNKLKVRDNQISHSESIKNLKNLGMNKGLINAIDNSKLTTLKVFKRQKMNVKLGILDDFKH